MIKQEFLIMYANCQLSGKRKYKLKNITRPVIFCVDCVFACTRNTPADRCDEFVFFDRNRNLTSLFLIEIKTGSNDITKVVCQLQGGADFIEKFMQNDPAIDQRKLKFQPIFVSKGLTPPARKKLREFSILINGVPQPIEHIQTNQTLPSF